MQNEQEQLTRFFEGLSSKQPEVTTPEETETQRLNKILAEAMAKLVAQSPKVTVDNMPEPVTSVSTPDSDKVVKAIQALPKQLTPAQHDNSDVIAAIKQLGEHNKDSISKIDLKPNIKVAASPAPVVKVDAPDLSGLEKAIKANKPEPVKVDFSGVVKLLQDNLKATNKVNQTIRELKFPVSSTPTDPLIRYMVADVDDATTVKYFGHTQVGGAWYIRKYDESVSPKTNRFVFGEVNGGTSYTTAWANRASLTYSLWGN